jgi:hypothetical protein
MGGFIAMLRLRAFHLARCAWPVRDIQPKFANFRQNPLTF